MTSTSRAADIRAAADACIDLLREDRPRMQRLLRESAGLLDDMSALLTDAHRQSDAKQVLLIAKLLRGTALLPAALAAAALRKALSKLLPKAR